MCEQYLESIQNTKSKLPNGLTSTIFTNNKSTQKSDYQILKNTPIKFHNKIGSKKSFRKFFSDEETTLNISKFPMLKISTQRKLSDNYKNEPTFNIASGSALSLADVNTQLAFSNILYESPSLSHKLSSDKKGTCSKKQEKNALPFEDIYVCCISYTALNKCEISIDFMDRFEIISIYHYKYSDLCFVRNLCTNQKGFVPRYTLCQLSQFLKDVRKLKN